MSAVGDAVHEVGDSGVFFHRRLQRRRSGTPAAASLGIDALDAAISASSRAKAEDEEHRRSRARLRTHDIRLPNSTALRSSMRSILRAAPTTEFHDPRHRNGETEPR